MKIIGIGIDICSVNRIKRLLNKNNDKYEYNKVYFRYIKKMMNKNEIKDMMINNVVFKRDNIINKTFGAINDNVIANASSIFFFF